MDDNRIADYFLISGIRDDRQPCLNHDSFVDENFALKEESEKVDPITDIAVIIPTWGEECPEGYKRIEKTVNGYQADLNHGSIRSPEMYLCYRRGRDRSPLTDIGVMYHGKERLVPGCQIVQHTPLNHNANVNNTTSKIYLTYMRAEDTAPADTLVVTDICIILTNKGEAPPHTYMQIPKSLNKALVGSDVYICYKKSERNAKTIVYEPQMLSRYPEEDDREFPLPVSVERFCLPLGATIEVWPVGAKEPTPKFSTFVLTGVAGSKSYGAAVSFHEEMSKSDLDPETLAQLGIDSMSDRRTVHVSKSIGLISRWPFFDAFEQFLLYLYGIPKNNKEQNLPLERCISHFFNNVPFPTNLIPKILVQFPSQLISVSKPIDTPLPQNGASYRTLLSNLGPENCLLLLALTLCEKYMIIHSLRTPVLTSTAEAVTNMGFPLRWSCIHIPLLPVQLAKTLESPVPIVIGFDSKIFDTYEVNTENFVLVDLDTCQIVNPHNKEINVKLLPKKPAKILKNTLDRLFKENQELNDKNRRQQQVQSSDLSDVLEHKTNIQQNERKLEKAICEAFLRFMSCVLKGYSGFLKPVEEGKNSKDSVLFDTEGFLKSKNESYRRLLREIVKTQAFYSFIQERSFVSDQDTCLTFFDECIEKVDENKDEPPLFEADVRNQNTRFIAGPEEGDEKYKYSKFPLLDRQLLPVENFIMKTPETKTLKHAGQMTLRTKLEYRSAQRNAEKISNSPDLWVKYLMRHCYSLWFIHLPSYVRSAHSKEKALRTAFDILVRLQKSKLIAIDEVCYTILMQLCGTYDQPSLAQSLLSEMRKHGVHPNAMTYGYYNKAVYDSQSASSDTRSAYRRWILLRNIILAIAQFRINLVVKRNNLLIVNESDDCVSRNSLDFLIEDGAKIPTEAPPQKMLDGHSTSSRSDDRTSIGGVSDRGYSSLSNDDGRKLSHINGSQDSLNKLRKASQTTPVFKRLFTPSKGTDGLKRVPYAKRVTNIVRPSLAKSASLPRGTSEKYGSQAGDLITSCVFQEPMNRIQRRRSSFGIEKTERPKQLITDAQNEVTDDRNHDKVKCSPSHSAPTPTPVTTNDPLGHFTTPPSTAASTPQKSVPKSGFTEILPFQNWGDNSYLSDDTLDTLTISKCGVSDEDLGRSINQTPKSRKPLARAESFHKVIGSAKKYASSALRKIGEMTSTPTKSTGSTGSLVSGSAKNSITEEERSWESLSQDRLSLDDGLDKKRNHLAWDAAWDILGKSRDYLSTALSLHQESPDVSDQVSTASQHLMPFDGETLSINQQIAGSNQSLSQIVPVKIEAQISSNFRCEHCQSLLYDEEITAGWTANDCNFNTYCQFCSKEVVTRLIIYMKDFRGEGSRKELSVLYLNPLVLRRQLETIIESEGDLSLADENFSNNHTEVFWNLLWFFRRLNVPSNLPGLLAKDVSSRQVVIRTIWDNLKIQDEVGKPMYVLHDQSNSPSPTVQALLTDQQPFSANIRNDILQYIIGNDLMSAVKLTLSERQRLFNVNQAASSRFRQRSIYKNLLFLACYALGRQNIDLDAFDREYALAYQQLTPAERRQLRKFDQPPNMRTIWARKMFEPLELVAIQL